MQTAGTVGIGRRIMLFEVQEMTGSEIHAIGQGW